MFQFDVMYSCYVCMIGVMLVWLVFCMRSNVNGFNVLMIVCYGYGRAWYWGPLLTLVTRMVPFIIVDYGLHLF